MFRLTDAPLPMMNQMATCQGGMTDPFHDRLTHTSLLSRAKFPTLNAAYLPNLFFFSFYKKPSQPALSVFMVEPVAHDLPSLWRQHALWMELQSVHVKMFVA